MAVRVLHLISSPFELGGAERLLLDMADHYDTSRFDVSYCNLFYDPGTTPAFNSELVLRGLPDLSLSGNHLTNVPRTLFRLRRLCHQKRFDIIHTHLAHATFVGWLVTSTSPNTTLVTSHHYTSDIFQNSDTTFSRKFAGRLGNFGAAHAPCVIAVSGAVKNDLIACGVDPAKIRVIHNGIDLDSFDAQRHESARPWGAGQDELSVLVTVGSLTERKGHHVALKAMPTVLRRFPKAKLLVVGAGELHDRLVRLAEHLKIVENVTFLGFQTNVAPYLSSADLYVHPALQEPFGIAVLEAMAAKKCVIATNVGGIPEIVVNGQTGILVPPSDPELLAKAICTALADPIRVRRMGLAGRERVQDFDIKKVVASYQAVYVDLGRGAYDNDRGTDPRGV